MTIEQAKKRTLEEMERTKLRAVMAACEMPATTFVAILDDYVQFRITQHMMLLPPPLVIITTQEAFDKAAQQAASHGSTTAARAPEDDPAFCATLRRIMEANPGNTCGWAWAKALEGR